MLRVKYYKLLIDNENKNFYLNLLDENKKEIKDYTSLEASPLNETIIFSNDNEFTDIWNEKNKKDKLELNEELLEELLKLDNFVDKNYVKIKLKKIENISLIIKDDQKNFNRIYTKIEINENLFSIEDMIGKYFYKNGEFYYFDNSEEFFELGDLFVNIEKYELESFLTLVVKNYKNIDLKYEDYSLVSGEIRESIPQLIIEKISIDSSLYLRVNSIISTMDYDFLVENKIEKVVTINELEKIIYISEINFKKFTEDIEVIIKILQNLQKEKKFKTNFFYDDKGFIILQEELAKEFVKKELLQLATHYNIIGTDKLRKYNIKAIRPKIVGNLSYSIDYLEGNISLDLDGEKFSIQQILNNYKKDNYITLSDGTNALISKKYIEKLQRIFKNEDNEKVKISFFDLPLINDLIEDKVLADSFVDGAEFYRGINDISKMKTHLPKLNIELREYQKYGYKWLSYLLDNNLGACLADDMGLGKTIQAISLLTKLHTKKNKKSLVIMPKSLIYNWDNEISKFSPNLNPVMYYGSNRNTVNLQKAELILTTYGTVRNDIEELMKINFDLIILDESQSIKNVNSQTTKSIMLINAKNRIALSGTPIENNLTELYSLFRFLNPTMFGSLQEFNNNYIVPIQKYGDTETIQELRKKIYPFILRRMKKDVLKDLPEKIEKVQYIDMEPEHRKFYEERRQYYYNSLNENISKNGIAKSKFFILQALNELRHITSSPETKKKNITSSKKEVLIENILEATRNGHKVLVFVNYISSIDSICKSLEENNIKYLKMSGLTKDRQDLVNKFQEDNRYKVFVMTLKTGGVGLNLTSADTIFIYDPWWNKTVENQAVDRAYRLGQDKTVFSYKLILRNTIEEKILKLQEMKNELLNNLISEDNISTKNLTEKDIEYILGK